MSEQHDKIIAERKVRDGWLGVVELTAEMAGEVVTRTLIDHPSGSLVLAYDPSRKVASIVRQTRLPVLRSGAQPLREPVAGVSENERPEVFDEQD